MQIQSTFALLDVKRGRKALEKHFRNRPRMGQCPEDMRVPVTITGYLDGIWGDEDGVSREFTVTVQKVETA